MKKIFLPLLILCTLVAWAKPATVEAPETAPAAWITYDRAAAPEWAAECPSYEIKLAADGVAYLSACFDGRILQAVEGRWTVEGGRYVFDDLAICDAYTGKVVKYKSATVKNDGAGVYLAAKTSAGLRIFLPF